MNIPHKILPILFVMVLQSTGQTVFCQKISYGIDAVGAIDISPRWMAFAEVQGAIDKFDGYSHWGSVSTGASFQLYDAIDVFVRASLSRALYHGSINDERIMTMLEGVQITTKSGFVHYLYVDQRRLKFKPSNMSVNCSHFGYSVMYDFSIRDDKWSLVPQLACVANIKSDVTSSDLLQRIKLMFAAERRINDRLAIGLRWCSMFGGENQIYMGDCHNLHTISLFVNWDSWRRNNEKDLKTF